MRIDPGRTVTRLLAGQLTDIHSIPNKRLLSSAVCSDQLWSPSRSCSMDILDILSCFPNNKMISVWGWWQLHQVPRLRLHGTIFLPRRSQWPHGLSVGLWPLACWDCGFESHRRHGFCLMSDVLCQVEASATGRLLVQRSPTDCGASFRMIYKPQEWGGLVGPQHRRKENILLLQYMSYCIAQGPSCFPSYLFPNIVPIYIVSWPLHGTKYPQVRNSSCKNHSITIFHQLSLIPSGLSPQVFRLGFVYLSSLVHTTCPNITCSVIWLFC
jgi:hypothetical protein